MITLRNLEKSFAHGVSKTFVLRQISLEVKAGEFLSIMGPSGAGKSTLLHILGMHDSDWTGEFEFAGYPVHAMKPKQRAKLHKQYIGFVVEYVAWTTGLGAVILNRLGGEPVPRLPAGPDAPVETSPTPDLPPTDLPPDLSDKTV